MSLSVKQQALYWGIALAVLIFVIWLLRGALMPFVAGAAIAYFLDPVADRLERAGMGRLFATIVITSVAVLALVLVVLLVVPALIHQAEEFVTAMPGYVASFQTEVMQKFPAWFGEDAGLWRALESFRGTLQDQALSLANSILTSSLAVVDFIMLLVVAPVVAFYLLLDWDHLIARVDSYLPREHSATIRRLARDIDRVLAGFVRGQLSVCAILGIYYAVALAVIGLQFGAVIGLMAGLISFIPFVGSIIGGVVSIGLALVQFWGNPTMIVAVAAVFFAGQAVEGNFLTPRLVGGSVGLHPVWLMFALSAFGALFGFTGLLIAVPVAASIGVLSRFALETYTKGRLYLGPQDTNADE